MTVEEEEPSLSYPDVLARPSHPLPSHPIHSSVWSAILPTKVPSRIFLAATTNVTEVFRFQTASILVHKCHPSFARTRVAVYVNLKTKRAIPSCQCLIINDATAKQR